MVLFQLSERRELRADGDPEFSMTAPRAIEALWHALRGSCFEASGIDMRTGKRVSIPSEQWRDLEWFEERGHDVIRASDIRLHGGVQYEDVTVPMRSVVRLWRSSPKPKPYLPDMMRPEDGSYMPLYCAAQWIATEGGAISFDPEDRTVWKRAFDDLLARIASGKVEVLGVRNGEREPVPAYQFVDRQVSYPFHADLSLDNLMCNELHLSSYPYLDEEHWQKGFDHSLQNHQGPRWSRLMVRSDDVARLWPFGAGAASPRRVGRPPTVDDAMLEEFSRVCEAGALEPTLKKQCEALRAWAEATYPNKRPPKWKTIERNIASKYWQARNPRN